MADEKSPEAGAAAKEQFVIQRIYSKDLSFESPHAPQVFQGQWAPQMNVDLHTEAQQVGEGVHEVVLAITVTVTNEGKTAFLVEAKQAGIFTLQGMDPAKVGPVLGSFCPNILFPYARETIADLVSRGGFPPLHLAPVNFEALYAEHLRRRQQQETDAAPAATH